MSPQGPEQIRSRLHEAQEGLSEAGLLLQSGYLRAAVSRLYYACFHAAEALLRTEGLESKKHSGVRSLFEQHWVASGKLPREMGKFYHHLLDSRLEADYYSGGFERSAVERLLNEARRFVNALTAEVEKKLGGKSPLT
jgi:uncharacterized protein (UPF0332 family)